jgi:hypothetical protein
MVLNLLFYQLLLVALVLICLLIHVWWPDHPRATSHRSLKLDKPRRTRSKAPQPFTGFIHKRSCPSSLRLNTRGLPGDRHRGKTALPIGPS